MIGVGNSGRNEPEQGKRTPVAREICITNEDPFSAAAVREARAVDDRLRELAPAVKLARENITLLTRYEHVSAGLRDWKTFSSTSRP